MKNFKKTSKAVASKASKALLDKRSSKTNRQLAGSVLAQTRTTKEPSKETQNLASEVLKSAKYNSLTKLLAASVLSQSNASD
jgi:hypothetical protein